MAYIWQAEDDVEPISDSNIEGIANMANYAVLSGCAQSYSATDMVVTIAAGSVIYNGSPVTVAGNTVTLVADPTDPRWTWIVVDNTGTADIVSGTPAPIGPGTGPEVPELGGDVGIALILVPAGQTIANDITYKIDKRVFSPNNNTYNYNSSTQTVSASTTLVDVAGANAATFTFPVDASSTYEAVYYLPFTFTGTGGLKFQITGPAAATDVSITGWRDFGATTDNTSPLAVTVMNHFTAVTAFSSNIAAADAAANSGSATAGKYSSTDGSLVEIHLRLINGANAGNVVLQFAQNSANGTTVLGLGATMVARRIR